MAKVIKIVLAVVLFGAAAVVAFNYFNKPAPQDEFLKEVMWFRCDKSNCKNEWSMTAEEVQAVCKEKHTAQPPCPKCGSVEAYDMYQCDACKKLLEPVGHGSRPTTCPYCKAVQPIYDPVQKKWVMPKS